MKDPQTDRNDILVNENPCGEKIEKASVNECAEEQKQANQEGQGWLGDTGIGQDWVGQGLAAGFTSVGEENLSSHEHTEPFYSQFTQKKEKT